MNTQNVTFAGGAIFDGSTLRTNSAARFVGGALQEVIPTSDLANGEHVEDLAGDILSPGYVDLQVNGGGGVMFNDAPTVETLTRIVRAHRQLGATSILPTLITDTTDKTQAAVEAAIRAVRDEVPGIIGLHLEGPHLSVRRKGAHDAELIMPMSGKDLDNLIAARENLPALMVTIAPESVSKDQVATLSRAGIVVSLGHTDASFETCLEYADAGAICATHLFNAMSQLGSREPGLVGAVLSNGALSAGLIADTVHVHAQTMRAAFASKQGPGRIFLVSDAMAVAGTPQEEFRLEGRLIQRKNGRLTLQDGTLAGADLDLTTALRNLTQQVGIPLEQALAAATRIPADIVGIPAADRSAMSSFIRIRADLSGAVPVLDI